MASVPRALAVSTVLLPLVLLVLFTGPSRAQVTLPLPATEQVKVLGNTMAPGDSDLVIRPDNPQVMYWAVMNVGVLKSVDGGATWTPKNYGLPTAGVTRLAMDPLNPNHLMVGFDGHFFSQGPPPYRSLDGGERWEPTVVCQSQENLRQQSGTQKMLFDPTAPNRFYYLVDSQFLSCGAFYRSCDQGATYDRNPNCFGPGEYPRPACAATDPEPVNNFTSNDANFLEVHRGNGTLFGTTGTHAEECALMTSRDKGGYWTWEDVVDSTGTFIGAADQSVSSLFLFDLMLAPSDSDIRYGVIDPAGTRCGDGKAYPRMNNNSCTNPQNQIPLLVRWSGELSGNVDCQGNNDCDGDATPDRVWRPIYDLNSLPGGSNSKILVHSTDPNRVFLINYLSPVTLLMLSPADAAHPEITPWPATTLGTGYAQFSKLIADPANPNSFYILESTQTNPARIIRISSNDGWSTWQQTVVATSTDYLHVYDLTDTRGSDGHKVIVGAANHLHILDELGGGASSALDKNAPAIAVTPSNPDRVFAKRSWALQMGISGFDSLTDMDNVEDRRTVMCTNVFNDIAVDPDDISRIYVATEGGIWMHPNAHVPVDSADLQQNGLLWSALARSAQGLTDEYVWRLVFDPSDLTHDTLLAGTRSGAIFQSVDRGLSWSPTVIHAPVDFLNALRDVRDFKFLGSQAYAATGAGVLRRETPQSLWRPVVSGDKIWRVAVGATGQNRIYAAGGSQLYRSRDGGNAWETLPLTPRPPYSAVLETTSRGGRHHLWVPDYRAGLYRISSTMKVRSGTSEQQVVLSWTESQGSPYTSYSLYYGQDPDLLNGTGAAEGASPVALGNVSSATLTGLDFQGGTWYVALRGNDGSGTPGPMGLPLEIQFSYAFSPQPTFTDLGTCPFSGRLDWSPVPGATEYRIYRSTIFNGPFSLLTSLAAGETTYVDNVGTFPRTYYYYMTAIRGGVETVGGEIIKGVEALNFDGDSRANCSDNCPAVYNSDQVNTDQDNLGDACDPDDDNDGDPDLTDCAPLNPNISHVAIEQCNGLDDDCDGTVPPWESDSDGDLYRVCDGDCNDADVSIHPGAAETCNLKDDDCDTLIDENPEFDMDHDGWTTCEGDVGDYDHDPRYNGIEMGGLGWQDISCLDGLDNDLDLVIDCDCADNVTGESIFGPGSTTGGFASTRCGTDTASETAREGGNPKTLTVFWTLPIIQGNPQVYVDFRLKAHRLSATGDTFQFSVAQRNASGLCTANTGESYTPAITVTGTSSSDPLQYFTVGYPDPSTVSFCVKVVDINPPGADHTADSVVIDSMHFFPTILDAKVRAEQPVEGTIFSGNYLSTQTTGSGQETLKEGGAQARLIHTYTLTLPIGSVRKLYVEGLRPDNGDNDNFKFSWAVPSDPNNFQPIPGVLISSPVLSGILSQAFGPPAGYSGTLYIRVEDTDRTPGNTTLNTVTIDYLGVKTTP